ncbi:hypothetical protein [Streptomyces daliensis]
MSRSDTDRKKRRGKALRISAAFAVLLGLAGYAVTHYVTGGVGPARCIVRSPGEGAVDYEIEPDQAANAATIAAIASQRDLPKEAVTIALATAMQESGLRNLDHGDRDSVGLFQQRPSQGWGNEEEAMDPVIAAGKFYDHLEQIEGYTQIPLTDAAQRVQLSAHPEAYAKHEANAKLLANALTGGRAAAFHCTAGYKGPSTKAGSPEKLREQLVREFGRDVLPAEARRASATTGAGSGRSAERQREIVIPAGADERGWELAYWAVAHSAGLRIAEVSFQGHVWDAVTSEEGWHESGDGAPVPDDDAAVTIRLTTGQ